MSKLFDSSGIEEASLTSPRTPGKRLRIFEMAASERSTQVIASGVSRNMPSAHSISAPLPLAISSMEGFSKATSSRLKQSSQNSLMAG